MKYFFSLQPILQHASMLLAAGFICTAFGQTINLTGTIKDSSTQKGIGGALVSLIGLSLSTTTDTKGVYSLTSSSVRSVKNQNPLNQSPIFRSNILFFGVPENDQRVRLEIYDLSGRCIASLLNEKLSRGLYRINPFASTQAGTVYLVKLQTGDQTAILKILYVHNQTSAQAGLLGTTAGNNTVAKASAVNDTLVVSAAGYETGRKAISTYTGANDFLLVAYAIHIGTISFENGSYQSCIVPLVITVVDPDLSSATVPVYVKSTTDPAGITAVLKKTAGAAGTYSDSVFFSIVKSDSAKRLIKVGDGDTVTAFYGDVSPPALVYVNTVWTGMSGFVQPGGSPFLGVVTPMPVHVWDSDVSDSVLFVSVASKKDTAGIQAKLRLVKGSAGDYFGNVWFSLKGSAGDSVLGVMGAIADTISIVYHDQTPRQDMPAGVCIWLPVTATMFLDSAAYHGTGSNMTINLSDDDIADSTAVVVIASRKDPLGIKDTLRVTGGTMRNFTGTVGFTTTASRPGFISVQDGDSVVVSYQDDSPFKLVTQSAQWTN
jgi:hypothetical protein